MLRKNKKIPEQIDGRNLLMQEYQFYNVVNEHQMGRYCLSEVRSTEKTAYRKRVIVSSPRHLKPKRRRIYS